MYKYYTMIICNNKTINYLGYNYLTLLHNT